MNLRQPGFAYKACEPFTKYKERFEKFKETGDSRHICQNKLGKACFENDMAYGDFKDLTRRTASDKILRDKAFHIAKYPKYDGYQHRLASTVYSFLIKRLQLKQLKIKLCLIKNLRKNYPKQLLESLKNKKYIHLFRASEFSKGYGNKGKGSGEQQLHGSVAINVLQNQVNLTNRLKTWKYNTKV